MKASLTVSTHHISISEIFLSNFLAALHSWRTIWIALIRPKHSFRLSYIIESCGLRSLYESQLIPYWPLIYPVICQERSFSNMRMVLFFFLVKVNIPVHDVIHQWNKAVNKFVLYIGYFRSSCRLAMDVLGISCPIKSYLHPCRLVLLVNSTHLQSYQPICCCKAFLGQFTLHCVDVIVYVTCADNLVLWVMPGQVQ